MASIMERIENRWQDAVAALLGMWLFISPWVVGFADVTNAAWSAYITGFVIAAFAVTAIYAFQVWEEWVMAVVGAWLMASPWLLAFSDVAMALWNHMIVGLLVLGLAIWSATTAGGGQRHAAA